jgi:two-component sensor histidine kinase
MKRGHLFKKIIYSSWFLAGMPALLIILLIPSLGSRYILELEPAFKSAGKSVYADLNSDSISELVLTGKGVPFYFITVQNIDNLIYDQWNLADSLTAEISEIFFGNYDHDSYREIYVFSYKSDSLFLNVNEMLEPSGTKMERIYITKIGYLLGQVAATLKPAGFYDEDGDGMDELYFSISSYFQLGTRRMYYFDLAHKSLKSSQFCGSICLNPHMADTDGDKRPEIFGTLSASGNYGTNVPYSDSSTWLMVFDDRLNFEFPPVQFLGFANSLITLPYEKDRFRGYVLSHMANGTDTSVLKSGIMIYSEDGKLVKYRQYKEFANPYVISVFVIKASQADRICLLSDKFYELNERLEVIRAVDLPFHSSISSFQADMNADGKDEFLLYSENEKRIVVYSSDLHKLAELIFSTQDTLWKFYEYLSRDHEYKLFFSSGRDGYFLKLKRNDFYYLEYLVYPGIYFSFFFFILLIKRINTNQLKLKESLNQKLLRLQLQGIKAQLDPHFTFNTLNSIASLIYLEDRQAAYDYMRKFTQLLRSMLNDAEKIYRNLGEELDFVTTYLDLEKLRFGEKFDYEIEIGEGVNQREKVPKLVLQTFAENAVKHGIMPCERGGIIKISVKKEKDYLKLTIEDNGIGRERSAGKSNSTGMGLRLTNEFYEILNQINKRSIKHLITDLYNNSLNPSGTRVEVWVPVDEFATPHMN